MKIAKKVQLLSLGGLLTAGAVTTAQAVPSKYGSPGTTNPTTYSFTSSGNGAVTAYFVGETAGYGSVVGLSVNGAAPVTYGLQNHAHAYGASFVMGNVAFGDIIRFVLSVDTGNGAGPANPFAPTYFLNSDHTLNPSSENHIYSAPYAGDVTIPAGTYVGFEDISPLANGDRDYDDHEFVFTGPGLSKVPDGGASLALFGLALTGLTALRRKLQK